MARGLAVLEFEWIRYLSCLCDSRNEESFQAFVYFFEGRDSFYFSFVCSYLLVTLPRTTPFFTLGIDRSLNYFSRERKPSRGGWSLALRFVVLLSVVFLGASSTRDRRRFKSRLLRWRHGIDVERRGDMVIYMWRYGSFYVASTPMLIWCAVCGLFRSFPRGPFLPVLRTELP